jgi:predicted RNase H-like HicB family nuclease
MEYIAYFHTDDKPGFGVTFPDFPGCVSAGKNLQDARRMAAEALGLHISGMLEDGEKIPEPSTLREVKKDPESKGALIVLIEAADVEKTVRINITARESQIAAIDKRAQAARLSRSAYMVSRALGKTGTRA